MENRRDFIKKGLVGGVGLAIGGMGFSAKSYGSILGANDRLTLAVIGIHGRGTAHIDAWCALNKSHNVRLKTLCDTDEQFFPERSKTVTDKGLEKPITEWDMRKVFDDKEIDAVSFATPNHWHALASIWAMKAGKDVYCEKPAAYNIHEAMQMLKVSRETKKMLQIGSQHRSIPYKIKIMQALQQGLIG